MKGGLSTLLVSFEDLTRSYQVRAWPPLLFYVLYDFIISCQIFFFFTKPL